MNTFEYIRVTDWTPESLSTLFAGDQELCARDLARMSTDETVEAEEEQEEVATW